MAYRDAIRLQPAYPEAHCNLGHVLRDQGRFTDALEALRRGHALGSKTPGWSYPSPAWIRQCERLVELEGKLPAVLKGDAEPVSAADFAAQSNAIPGVCIAGGPAVSGAGDAAFESADHRQLVVRKGSRCFGLIVNPYDAAVRSSILATVLSRL